MKIAFLNRELVLNELRQCARELLQKDEKVSAVFLFGSLASGRALPSSDADILIMLRSHPEPRWFDRIPEYTDFFCISSLPVEVFPYTLDELNRHHRSSGFLRQALRESILLAGERDILALFLPDDP